MKKFILVIAIVLSVMLGACSLTPADRYDNFINDLDAITRLQTGLQQMENGGLTLYVRADMKTLERELSSLDTPDKEIREINENFVGTARLLQESMDAVKDDEDAAHAFLEAAKDSFDEGFLLFSSLETSGGENASE
ncbi:hypothetical protein [Christensenella intestinihominis]|uniref:hypothetical protein n=1 Tax=Christensenella intestinihominis TaxID=1851429 RepID=UPI0008313C88|nr:hypothetical protein [Christensenella intestinihominis]